MLELNLASTERVRAGDFRAVGPTVLAWRDRYEIEFCGGELAKDDPIPVLVEWTAAGLGDRAIASRFNRRWRKMLTDEVQLSTSSGVNLTAATVRWEMRKMGISEERIREAVEDPASFDAEYPLGPEWVKRPRKKILSS